MASNRGADKQAFMQIFSYALGYLTIEKLEEDGLLDDYYLALNFYEEKFGNKKTNMLTLADIDFLVCLQSKALTSDEICSILSIDKKTFANRINKAMEKGICSSFLEGHKKTRYYELTIYGRKRLRESIYEMENLE